MPNLMSGMSPRAAALAPPFAAAMTAVTDGGVFDDFVPVSAGSSHAASTNDPNTSVDEQIAVRVLRVASLRLGRVALMGFSATILGERDSRPFHLNRQ